MPESFTYKKKPVIAIHEKLGADGLDHPPQGYRIYFQNPEESYLISSLPIGYKDNKGHIWNFKGEHLGNGEVSSATYHIGEQHENIDLLIQTMLRQKQQ